MATLKNVQNEKTIAEQGQTVALYFSAKKNRGIEITWKYASRRLHSYTGLFEPKRRIPILQIWFNPNPISKLSLSIKS